MWIGYLERARCSINDRLYKSDDHLDFLYYPPVLDALLHRPTWQQLPWSNVLFAQLPACSVQHQCPWSGGKPSSEEWYISNSRCIIERGMLRLLAATNFDSGLKSCAAKHQTLAKQLRDRGKVIAARFVQLTSRKSPVASSRLSTGVRDPWTGSCFPVLRMVSDIRTRCVIGIAFSFSVLNARGAGIPSPHSISHGLDLLPVTSGSWKRSTVMMTDLEDTMLLHGTGRILLGSSLHRPTSLSLVQQESYSGSHSSASSVRPVVCWSLMTIARAPRCSPSDRPFIPQRSRVL